MNLRRLALFIVAFIFAVGAIAARAETGKSAPLRLGGTYLQLTTAHLEWREQDWAELFQHFEALGLSQLIVQWSVYEDRHFYTRSGAARQNDVLPIEAILNLADRAGMRVWLGLAFEEAYWREIAGKPEAVKPYLQKLAERSAAIAAELVPLVRRHASFAGWYIPHEIDDVSWRDPERRELLYDFVADLGDRLQAQMPDAAVAVSGFSNGAMDPIAFRVFWETLLRRAPSVDTVLFQDGIGARKLDFYELPLYTEAIRDAAVAADRKVVAIVEVFDQVAGPPLNDQAFQAVPAPLKRIIRQLELAQGYAPTAVAFSVPEYLSPKGGDAARTLYEEYLVTCVARRCASKGK